VKTFLVQFFTWWNGQTIGTRFFTWRMGEFVGEDTEGNRYYRSRKGDRRWVIYNGPAEASRIPPGWYGWMHRRTDVPPTEDSYRPLEWEAPHMPNLTGTPYAYRPKGSLLTPERRPEVTGDYDAWKP
jgi:NADH:ubiquinone oxidoreductase subunit